MSITRLAPNTIHLGGSLTIVNDLAASESITPGMLIERFNNAGIIRFRKSTRTGLQNSTVALNHPMVNRGVDDAYSANDLVEAGVGQAGTTMWMLIASGQNIVAGGLLSDAGDGTLKAVSGVAVAEALESVNNTAGPSTARIRVEIK